MKANILPLIVAFSTQFACILAQVVAQMNGQIPPWPSRSISEASNYYPGYIPFRGIMIYVAPMMQVVVYIGFWWLTQTAKTHTRGEV